MPYPVHGFETNIASLTAECFFEPVDFIATIYVRTVLYHFMCQLESSG